MGYVRIPAHPGSMVWKSLPAKSGSHRTEKKTECRACKDRPRCPLPEIAQDGVHQAPHGLGCDQEGCQALAPEPAKVKASTGHHQNCAEHQEGRARGTPEGCEPVVCPCVQRPQTTEKGLGHISVAPARTAMAAPKNRKTPNAVKPQNEFSSASMSNQQGALEQKPSQPRRGRFSHTRHKGRCCEDGRRRRCPWNARR